MKSSILLLISALMLTFSGACHAQFSKKKVAQVKRNADGTITELEQLDKRTIERRTRAEQKGGNGVGIISARTIYTKDDNSVLRQAIIYDGAGNTLFKIRYGYHRTNGRLICEELYDAQAQRVNEKGQVIPLQRLYYKYDPHGNRSKPFAITTTKKGKVEEYQSWSKHIKDRLKKHNFDEDAPLLPDQKALDSLK